MTCVNNHSSKANEAELAKRNGEYEHGTEFIFAFQVNHIELKIPQDRDGWEMGRLNPLVVSYIIP